MRRAASENAAGWFFASARALVETRLARLWGVPREAVTPSCIRERLGARGDALAEVIAADQSVRFGRATFERRPSSSRCVLRSSGRPARCLMSPRGLDLRERRRGLHAPHDRNDRARRGRSRPSNLRRHIGCSTTRPRRRACSSRTATRALAQRRSRACRPRALERAPVARAARRSAVRAAVAAAGIHRYRAAAPARRPPRHRARVERVRDRVGVAGWARRGARHRSAAASGAPAASRSPAAGAFACSGWAASWCRTCRRQGGRHVRGDAVALLAPYAGGGAGRAASRRGGRHRRIASRRVLAACAAARTGAPAGSRGTVAGRGGRRRRWLRRSVTPPSRRPAPIARALAFGMSRLSSGRLRGTAGCRHDVERGRPRRRTSGAAMHVVLIEDDEKLGGFVQARPRAGGTRRCRGRAPATRGSRLAPSPGSDLAIDRRHAARGWTGWPIVRALRERASTHGPHHRPQRPRRGGRSRARPRTPGGRLPHQSPFRSPSSSRASAR